jgi:hypothetical protein
VAHLLEVDSTHYKYPPALFLLSNFLINLDIVVPQGSILGHVLFINDIFFFVKDSTIYNYADDNTVSNCDNDIDVVTTTLENDSMELINWFSPNAF